MSNPAFDPNAAASTDAGLFGLPKRIDALVHIVPVPFEATTSYGSGAARGPAAILKASRQVDLWDRETGRPWQSGIRMLPVAKGLVRLNASAKRDARAIIARGGNVGGSRALAAKLARVNAAGARVNDLVRAATEKALDDGRLVGVLGGDHAAPFGAMEALAERHPGMGVLHVDAHADLREAYEGFTWSHASIMHNVATRCPGVARIVQVGIRDAGEDEVAMIAASRGRIVTHWDADWAAERLGGATFATLARDAVAALPKKVYVSFDIDGLDPALCPHTGTPVPGGLTFAEACFLMREVVRTGREIIGFDLCEVAPGPAGDEWDANVGARVLYRLIGYALQSRKTARQRA